MNTIISLFDSFGQWITSNWVWIMVATTIITLALLAKKFLGRRINLHTLCSLLATILNTLKSTWNRSAGGAPTPTASPGSPTPPPPPPPRPPALPDEEIPQLTYLEQLLRWSVPVALLVFLAVAIWGFVTGNYVFGCGGAVMFLYWLWNCLESLPADRMGAGVLLGKAYRFADSGLQFLSWPFEWFRLFPKPTQEVDYVEADLVTNEGLFDPKNPSWNDDRILKEHTSNDGEVDEAKLALLRHSRAKLVKVKVSFFFSWPRSLNLIFSVMNGPNPFDEAAVVSYFEEVVKEATRARVGAITWARVLVDQKGVTELVTKSAGETASSDPNNPISRARVERIRIVISDVKLPPELEKAITEPEVKEREALAAIKAAKGEGQAAFLKLEGQARGQTEIYKAIDEHPEAAAQLTAREGLAAPSNTFVLPTSLLDWLGEIVGRKTGGK